MTMPSYKALITFTGTVSEMREFLDDMASAVIHGGAESHEKSTPTPAPSDGHEDSSGAEIFTKP